MADSRIDEVLSFWFGAPGEAPEARQQRWFTRDPELDRVIGDRFGALLEEAAAGKLDAWSESPRGALALVVVLDQFSRNVFRDTPRAFAQDARALAATREALAKGHDRELSWIERYMLLMPYMHAEAPDAQRESVARFEALHADAAAAGASEGEIAALAVAADYARRHAVIVERFGRYPHRNAILGRPSTDEEVGFLREPGSSF